MPPRQDKTRIFHEGYVLYKKYERKDGISVLYCYERASSKCMAVYHRDINDNITMSNDHCNHTADPDRVIAQKARCDLKTIAKSSPSTSTPRTMITMARAGLGGNARASVLLGSTSALSRVIHRVKPKDPDDSAAREIPIRITPKYSVTKAGQPFMMVDSLVTDPNEPRFIIFSSEEQQRLLASSTTVTCDGTFESVKGIFGPNAQLWVLMVPLVSGEFVIVGWVLMENRLTVTYERVLNAFKALPTMTNWSVLNVMADFEKGARRAWLNGFPNVKFSYCLFHYEQSLRRYVTKNRVNLNVRDEFDVYKRCRNLPLIPELDVRESLDDMLRMTPNACNGLLKYLSENYVNGSRAHGPMFKPEEWIIHGRPPGVPRTNNACEASNSIMNSDVKTYRGIADGASLLQFFQQEEQRISGGAAMAATHPSHRMALPISKKVRERDHAVQLALSNPHNLRGFNLLDHISCTLAPFQK